MLCNYLVQCIIHLFDEDTFPEMVRFKKKQNKCCKLLQEKLHLHYTSLLKQREKIKLLSFSNCWQLGELLIKYCVVSSLLCGKLLCRTPFLLFLPQTLYYYYRDFGRWYYSREVMKIFFLLGPSHSSGPRAVCLVFSPCPSISDSPASRLPSSSPARRKKIMSY